MGPYSVLGSTRNLYRSSSMPRPPPYFYFRFRRTATPITLSVFKYVVCVCLHSDGRETDKPSLPPKASSNSIQCVSKFVESHKPKVSYSLLTKISHVFERSLSLTH